MGRYYIHTRTDTTFLHNKLIIMELPKIGSYVRIVDCIHMRGADYIGQIGEVMAYHVGNEITYLVRIPGLNGHSGSGYIRGNPLPIHSKECWWFGIQDGSVNYAVPVSQNIVFLTTN